MTGRPTRCPSLPTFPYTQPGLGQLFSHLPTVRQSGSEYPIYIYFYWSLERNQRIASLAVLHNGNAKYEVTECHSADRALAEAFVVRLALDFIPAGQSVVFFTRGGKRPHAWYNSETRKAIYGHDVTWRPLSKSPRSGYRREARIQAGLRARRGLA